MPERNKGDYRYGFNGKENDNEAKGEGNQQDYGFRIYDPRIAKFLSEDPLTAKYPELTPYQFASNRPIDGIDQDGLEYIKGGEQVAPPSNDHPNGQTFEEVFGCLYESKKVIFNDETYYDVGRLFFKSEEGYLRLDNYSTSDKLIVRFFLGEEPEWITKARGEFGVKEALADGTDNPVVQGYQDVNRQYKPQGTQEGFPWCASFVGWSLNGPGCNAQLDPSAQSYSNVQTRIRGKNGKDTYSDPVWGQAVATAGFGAIGVRVNPHGQWHVGFVVGKCGSDILLLGGNQGDMVSIIRLPASEFRAFVYPSNYEIPAIFNTLKEYKMMPSRDRTR